MFPKFHLSREFVASHTKPMPFFYSFTRAKYINHQIIFSVTVRPWQFSLSISWLNKSGKY